MAVASNQVSVAATATAIVAAVATATYVPQEGAFSRPPTRYVALHNDDATNAVYIGGSGVTTTTGLKLTAGQQLTVWLYPDEALYGIVSSGTVTVSYVESGS